MITKDKKILIVGLGLMGGSYADALTKAGFEVGAITRSQRSIDFAIKNGIIRHGFVEVEADYVGQFDIIVFSLYPKTFVEWIERHQQLIKSGALITDVTGVKGPIVEKIQHILRPDVEFIAAHPMCGKEVSGVENASSDIFIGANYIVTPTARNTENAIEECEALGKILGCTTISRLTPEYHDEIIGFLSQLTHCIAVSLMNCKDSKDLVRFTGDSFRDLTRIARINDEMWSELFLLNKTELLKQMDLFASQFSRIREAVANGDTDTLKEMMKISTERRNYFNKI